MKQFISRIRKALPSNRFARGVSLLVGGTASSHLITMLAAPLLTRFYQPEQFGLLALFTAWMSIFGVIASLRYQSAIVLPEDDDEANAIFLLTIAITVIATSAFTFIVWIFRQPIAFYLHSSADSPYLYLIPAGIFFIGILNAFNSLAIRYKMFSELAKSKLSQSVSILTIQLSGFSFGTAALLIGQVIGQAIGTSSLVWRMVRLRKQAMLRVTAHSVYKVAKKYKRFPLFETWIALFNTIGAQLPSILFAYLFGPAVAGFYILTTRVFSAPMQLLGQAISDVFYSDVAQANREGRLGKMTEMIHSRLGHVAMPPVLVLIIAGPDIFSQVFGENWKDAGVYAQWLSPWLYLVLVSSPLTAVFTVMNKMGLFLAIEALSLGVRGVAIIVGAYLGDAIIAVSLLAIGSAVCRVGMLSAILGLSGNTWKSISGPLYSALMWSVTLGSPLIAAKVWGADSSFSLISLAMVIVLIAGRYTFLLREAWA